MNTSTPSSRVSGCSGPHLACLWVTLSPLLPGKEQGLLSWSLGVLGLNIATTTARSGHWVPTPAQPTCFTGAASSTKNSSMAAAAQVCARTGARGGDRGGGESWKPAQPRYTGRQSNQCLKKNLINYTEPSKILNGSRVGEGFLKRSLLQWDRRYFQRLFALCREASKDGSHPLKTHHHQQPAVCLGVKLKQEQKELFISSAT